MSTIMERRSLKLLHAFLMLLLQLKPALGFISGVEDTNVRCIESERQALLEFRKGLVDDYGRLSSWGSQDENKNCCNWKGVHCSKQRGHVLELDLQGDSEKTQPLQGNISSSLLELHHLSSLDLSYNAFNMSQIPEFIGSFINLKNLNLLEAEFGGTIPYELGNLSHLESIDLSSNHLQGSIPDAFGKMNSLESLSLDVNHLEGNIPKSLGNICTLSSLSLSDNKLGGQLVEFINSLSGCAKDSLEMLDLSSNQITGSLPDFSIFPSLKRLYLASNNITGTVPKGIGNLHQLQQFDISFNSLHGVVTEVHLSNLSNLWFLDLSNSSLALELNFNWVPPVQLRVIYFAYCKLGPRFPSWLRTQWNISILDISDTGISDKIPKWFFDLPPTLQYLDMSGNRLEGLLHLFVFPPKMTVLSIAENRFSGTASSVCKVRGGILNFLDLSDNLLSGHLPNFFMHLRKLLILNLAGNNFTGEIPSSFGSLSQLHTLNLRNNSFSGELPLPLKYCSLLKFVDLGNNKFSGSVPAWIGEGLPLLNILILRSNKFGGSVPLNLCWLKYLRILDLSVNNISGTIPQCFNNFTAMAQKGDLFSGIIGSNYTDSYVYDYNDTEEFVNDATIIMKGRELEYGKYLGLLKIINLASNKLTGKVPSEISSLLELVVLNISRNKLIGEIPQMIGQLKQLQSLDMSRNQFSNEIPSSMSELHFLSDLDLSYNNLSGKIPSGTQLQSFDAVDFTGNWALCGPPLPNKCPGEETPNRRDQPTEHDGNEDNEKDGDEFEKWFFAAAGFGFFIGFWGICGPLLLKSSWRNASFLFLDNMKDWLYATKLAMCMERLPWKF